MKLKFRNSVFLVVYKKTKDKIIYLLLKRKLHWKGWECVKGGVEKGESLIQGLKRELREETGLKAEKIIDMHVKKSFLYPKNFTSWPGFKGMSYHLFAVEVNSTRVKFDNIEHAGFRWLEYSQAKKLLTHKEQKQALKLVNNKFSQ